MPRIATVDGWQIEEVEQRDDKGRTVKIWVAWVIQTTVKPFKKSGGRRMVVCRRSEVIISSAGNAVITKGYNVIGDCAHATRPQDVVFKKIKKNNPDGKPDLIPITVIEKLLLLAKAGKASRIILPGDPK